MRIVVFGIWETQSGIKKKALVIKTKKKKKLRVFYVLDLWSVKVTFSGLLKRKCGSLKIRQSIKVIKQF